MAPLGVGALLVACQDEHATPMAVQGEPGMPGEMKTTNATGSDFVAIPGNAGAYLSEEDRTKLMTQAEKGDAEAAFRLAFYYELCTPDRRQGMFWLKKAAALGHAGGQYNLAFFMWNLPEFKDDRRAVYWFQQAAQQGFPPAQHQLGEAYKLGRGIKRDYAKAKEWYEKAALSGDTSAMEELAELCQTTKYGEADLVTAYVWLSLAGKLIHPDSVAGRQISDQKKRISVKLNADELAQAVKCIEEIAPKIPNPDKH